MRKISKILIANRGEIAVRIQKTCKRLGIKTIQVFSDSDKDAYFLKNADITYSLGGITVAESYLNQEKLLKAIQESGADAVHPGYGFLSENAEFAEKVNSINVIFLGPKPDSIRLMGDKITSRENMQKAGIPVVPGFDGDYKDAKFLKQQAIQIGFPLMIKATAGGGGKGMKKVTRLEEFEELLELAQSEAQKAFGNSKVFLEKFIENPRHIEFQIFGDTSGRVVHLHERDCSLQRRNQKVIEETPAPNFPKDIKKKMGEIAIKCGEAIGYVGAGTVEFIVSESFDFYFLEMNTRLQVEHPVTEYTTGLDLVELQIKIAEGSPLPFPDLKTFDGSPVEQKGHSIQCRLYAEDALNDFLPSTGRILELRFPRGEGIRIDSGIEKGSEIGIYFDPMLAKLIVHAETREKALEKMHFLLSKMILFGFTTNLSFLNFLIQLEEFQKGNAKTTTILNKIHLFQKTELPQQILDSIFENLKISSSPWKESKKFGVLGNLSEKTFLDKQKQIFFEEVYISRLIRTDFFGHLKAIDATNLNKISFLKKGNLIFALWNGETYQITLSQDEDLEGSDLESNVMSKMPGKILKVFVEKNQKVQKGENLLVMEAMKMELLVKAPFSSEIEDVLVKTNDLVQSEQILVKLTKL